MIKSILRASLFIFTVALLALLSAILLDIHVARSALSTIRLTALLSLAAVASATIWLSIEWIYGHFSPRPLAVAIAGSLTLTFLHTGFVYAWTARQAWDYAGPKSALAAVLVPVRSQLICEGRLKSDVMSAEAEVNLPAPNVPAGFELDRGGVSWDGAIDGNPSFSRLRQARRRLENYQLALEVWVGLVASFATLLGVALIRERRKIAPRIEAAASHGKP